jgi:hypothetical protein
MNKFSEFVARNRTPFILLLACFVWSGLLAVMMSLHRPFVTFEVHVKLDERSHFSPPCAVATLSGIYGVENLQMGPRGESVRVSLPFYAAHDDPSRAEALFDFVPHYSDDQIVVSSEWAQNSQLVDQFEALMSHEISRSMDAIHGQCVKPGRKPWVAECKLLYGETGPCPQPSTSLPPPAPERRE